MTSTLRKMFLMQTQPGAIADVDDAWDERHRTQHLCQGCNRWRVDVPFRPVDVVLRKAPRAVLATTGLFQVAERPLAEILRQYGRGVVLGEVLVGRDENLLPGYRTVSVPREAWLEDDRGRYSRHRQCRKCGMVLNLACGWAHPVIVERYLDTHLAYLNMAGAPYVDERLIDLESLRERFPTLRFYPVPVVPEPLDGEVLPGDPGWTGTLVKVPLPKPPDHKPEKGIGLWL